MMWRIPQRCMHRSLSFVQTIMKCTHARPLWLCRDVCTTHDTDFHARIYSHTGETHLLLRTCQEKYEPKQASAHKHRSVRACHARKQSMFMCDLRYKSCAQFTRALIGRWSLDAQMHVMWYMYFAIFHCLLHYTYTYRYHVWEKMRISMATT